MNNIEESHIQDMDERIERFLRGQMNEEEEVSFREEIRTNPELREHAHVLSSLLKSLRMYEFLLDYEIKSEINGPSKICASYLPDDEDSIPTTSKSKSTIGYRIMLWIASAAAVIVLYFGYSFHSENVRIARVNEMLSPYYMYYDTDNLSRGDVDSVAIAGLYALFNRIPEEKDMTDVIAELEPIYESLDSDYTYYPYANDIAWNLALAYIKDEQTDKAIPLLEGLYRDNPDTPMSSKAQELLKKLRDL